MKTLRKLFLSLISLIVLLLLAVSFYTKNENLAKISAADNTSVNGVKDLECDFVGANGNFKCIEFQNELFVSLNSVNEKFDFNSTRNGSKLSLYFTKSKIERPTKPYESDNEYLWFKNVNVEIRSRVKYTSGLHQVPISSQWNKNGHIYPVQVAQYGLSHYSKWKSTITSNTIEAKMALDNIKNWIYSIENKDSIVHQTQNGFEFSLKGTNKLYVELAEPQSKYFYLNSVINTNVSLDLKFKIKFKQLDLKFNMYYVVYKTTKNFTNDKLIVNKKFKKAIYTIGGYGNQFNLVRNVCLDLCKSINVECSMNDLDSIDSKCEIQSVDIKGSGSVQNASLSSNAPHLDIARQTADYLVSTQNKHNGGWRIDAMRKFSTPQLYLDSEWYSALAQGQAISLLCRLYLTDKNPKYLQSALNGFNLFRMSTKELGVKRYFMNKFIWFEEYPTQPNGLYVLNGFLYSLFGLYDLISCLKLNDNKMSGAILHEIETYYFQAIDSLEHMIHMYDIGTRTYYDLRHFETSSVMPNIARWDYHVVHINQLLQLLTIQKSHILQNIADRWLNYTNGIWSSHN